MVIDKKLNTKLKYCFSALLLLAVLFLSFACKPSASQREKGKDLQQEQGLSKSSKTQTAKPQVVSSVGMIADIVRNIVGDRLSSTSIIATGIDPHLYVPTRTAIEKFYNAEIIFYNGLYLEGRMISALDRLKKMNKTVIAAAESLQVESLIRTSEEALAYDPHVWMDPYLWLDVAEVVFLGLKQKYPEHAEIFSQNFSVYKLKLKELIEYAETQIADLPKAKRVLVTAHDAFQYFGKRFDFEVIGIQGISTESEAGLQHIDQIVKLLVNRKIPAVFVESTVSARNVEALIEGAKASGHQVKVGGELFSDAMGKEGTPEGTYVGMIRHNIDTIVSALK
jgi:manganese/zinc/iron transport system substrate-binding protein